MIKKVCLNGVEVFPFTSDRDLLQYVEQNKGILVAINAEKILHATDQTRSIINRNMGYCDGAGAVRAMKQAGYKDVVKIAGCELWLKIIKMTYREKSKMEGNENLNTSFYFVGGKQEIIDETVEKLKNEFDGINIIGYRNGYIKTEEEKNALITEIAQKKPDCVFVAMGSPKQELLMEEMFKQHPAIYQGLGGSFDVYTGHVVRAPQWWVKNNLEWAYRLLREPKRIRRQIHLFKFEWWLRSGKFKNAYEV